MRLPLRRFWPGPRSTRLKERYVRFLGSGPKLSETSLTCANVDGSPETPRESELVTWLPRKKLIEVALPLEAINTASAREKSIRHGHPSTLHLRSARRPLAAAR